MKRRQHPPFPKPPELERWLLSLQRRGRRPRTIEAYTYAILAALKFWSAKRGPVGVREVRSPDFELWSRYLDSRGLTPISKEFYLLPLKSFFHWLERQGMVFSDPSWHLVVARAPRHLFSVVTEREVIRLLDSIDGENPADLRDRAILEVAYGAGLRCAELVALDVGAVDVGQRVVKVLGKGDKERVIPLPRLAVAAVQRYLESGRKTVDKFDNKAMWPDLCTGRRLTVHSIRWVTKVRSQKVGLQLTPHALRRAFATHMLRRGASPIDLQRLLGHSSFRQMRHYLRYVISDLKRMHNRSRLSR